MTSLASRAQTWEVGCATCGQKRWTYQPERPIGYVCARCRAGSIDPEKRARARRAGQLVGPPPQVPAIEPGSTHGGRPALTPCALAARIGAIPTQAQRPRKGWRHVRLSKAIDQFLDDCRLRNLAPPTIDSYESSLRFLVACAMVQGGEDSIHGFTEALVEAFFRACRQHGNAASTLVRKRAAVAEFARWAQRRRLVPTDPMLNAPRYRIPERLPTPFSREERDRLLALALPPQEALLRALLYHTGLRVGTLVRLRVKDIRPGPLGRLACLRVVTKGNKEIQVPIVPALAEALDGYLLDHTDFQSPSFLFQRRNGGPWSVRMIQRVVSRWGAEAGVRPCIPHRWRHLAATELFQAGADPRATQRFLGHARIQSTMRYTKIVDEDVERAAMLRARAMDRQPLPRVHTVPLSEPAAQGPDSADAAP